MAGAKRSDTNDLLTALRHPLRREILQAMGDGQPLSPRELATSLGQPLSNVSYHVRVLVECGVLELVRTRQVRGSMQHFYRATVEEGWARFVLGLNGEATGTAGRRGKRSADRALG